MTSAQLNDMMKDLRVARDAMNAVHDHLTGRSTHPLVDDEITSPTAFWIAIEAQRISDQMSALASNMSNASIFFTTNPRLTYEQKREKMALEVVDIVDLNRDALGI